MKRSEAAKYARWSAAAALLLAIGTAGVYLNRKWLAHRERAKAPPPAPQDVTRLSSGLTFSKVEGNQKIFTVEANRAMDFKDKAASLMEDVTITIFGKTGARHDTIHTKSCQYEKDGASIVCSGEVQLDLQSSQEADRTAKVPSAAQKVHAETRGVIFDRATGIAQSDQPVKFSFPNGRGEAVGVEYHSEEGAVRLARDVSFWLAPENVLVKGQKPATAVREPVHVTGKSADFERDSRVLHLLGPIEARTATAALKAGEMTLALDKGFRAERLVASAGGSGKKPELESRTADSQANLSGQTLTAFFAPEGWLTRMEAAGAVQGSQQSGAEIDNFNAESALLELLPKTNHAKNLRLNGDVRLKSNAEKTGESRTLQTSAFLVEFAEYKKDESAKPRRAETLGRGALQWTDPVQQTSSGTTAESLFAETKLAADKLELQFGDQGKASQLVAMGNVSTERMLPGRPAQAATAQSGTVHLLESGGWSQMELQGSVKLSEGDKNGEADHALFVRAAQTATLTGNAVVRDAATETRAPRITFAQNSGEIRADGGVRSTDFSAKGNGLQLAPAPANISADTLRANSKTSRALYTGHARLWQGDSVMEADSIELLRDNKILNASGNVRAVFPQTASQAPAPSLVAQKSARPPKTRLWHVTAGRLTYSDADATAHLEKNVVAKSVDQEMRAPIADLYFTRNEKPAPGPHALSSNPTASSQQISRAVGTGGVTVVQGTRRATAEHGEYSAAEGKFVMSGGKPTIFDASEGATTGHQLTFFLADDTIIVDSENGSRTLTKHRVEK